MDIRNKVAIVTGAASGIGTGIAKRFAADGARGVVLADLNLAPAEVLARDIGPTALAVRCDVGREADIQALVEAARRRFGQVDVYVSNAGIIGRAGGFELDDALWDSMWRIHGMAHVWAARAVVPEMAARGEGYFIVTASAAGLLNIVESAPYGVTKHAALAFAEWLRIAYGRRGVRVSCLCPQAVRSGMVPGDGGSAGQDGILTPEQVADEVTRVMQGETFLILPHPQVLDYFRAKGQDYDRWIGGMQKIYARHQQAS
ncbi:MAG: Oxidoreductase, short-chain dehydrogenase/reductase family [Burkholderiaceae bacterium]|jgi:NAD(P)-dependent dehydrogenase (short-subunit alcohol dehydrogenase family)|nr:MAG: Oxidoreductase, short-chain dehydrogenase/reductase family [Burkholderiaceae bacterium]